MKKVLVYGSQEFGRVIKDMLLYMKYPFAGFIDDINIGEDIVGNYSFIKGNYDANDYQIVLAIGYKDLASRLKLFQRIKDDFQFLTLIHDTAYIRNIHNLGSGSIVMSNATIDANAKIGEFVVVWPGVVVNHDSVIGNNTFLSPNCTICGSVKIGESCFIGAGAVVVDHSNVPDNTFIKAGSVFFNKN